MKLLIFTCLLLGFALCRASIIPASAGLGIPVAAHGPALVPVATSHQFVNRNYNGYFIPTTTTTSWPGWSPYPNTYYKYHGGYPTYTYPYAGYPYGYYPYGYGYKSVW